MGDEDRSERGGGSDESEGDGNDGSGVEVETI
jgi:hypothetical protein